MSIEVSATFRQLSNRRARILDSTDIPLSCEKLGDYISENETETVQGRIISTSGETLTFIADTQYLDLEDIEKMAKNSGAFIGFMSIQGYVDSQNISDIQNDSYTYLLDTSCFNLGDTSNMTERNYNFPNDYAWELEESKDK